MWGAGIGFFLIVTFKTSNIVEFDPCISLVYLILVNKVAFVNRVAYSSGFQIFFGKAFKCIHVA